MASASSIDKSPIKPGDKIGIIGSGIIGRSWAMLFAAAGYRVEMYDSEPSRVTDALADIQIQLAELGKKGLLRGKISADDQYKLIGGAGTLVECLQSAVYVQECVPESLELKKQIFADMDAVADNRVILASSTSSMPASKFAADAKHAAQVLVVHPVNPPFYCPLTEVVPMPVTDSSVVERTMGLMSEIGQTAVLVKKEITGFALNRVQYALLAECWSLVENDVLSVEDVDKVMKDGLALRYAFMGPFETCHLNADGMQDYLQRYSWIINAYFSTMKTPTSINADSPTAARVCQELDAALPNDKLAERRLWRNNCLAALAKLKSELPK